MNSFQHFGVIGAGAWGTALAQALCAAGRDVTLWAREEALSAQINTEHENKTYLAGVKISERVKATSDLEALACCDAWLLVVPVQHMRSICHRLAVACAGNTVPVLLCSKGIEKGTLAFPAQIIAESLSDHPSVILSGPSFAMEVARGLPTAVTLACQDEVLGMALCQAIGSLAFRPYYSSDVIGAQVGGAIKNVMAVAAGIASGCQMGENARAALITRGLAEIMRLGKAMGARGETLMGLSGIGDLVLTCSSTQSRNMSLGYDLGQGKALADILGARNTVAEGVPTTTAAAALALDHQVEMPIVMAVDAILNKGADVREVVANLLSRPIKAESAGYFA